MTMMTAAQRREGDAEAYDTFTGTCLAHRLLAGVAATPTSLVLFALAGGTLRHAELGRVLPDLAATTLAQALRALERDGFIGRGVAATVPVQSEYTLTLLGERLIPLLNAVKDWAEHNIGEIHAARERYDADEGVDEPVPDLAAS
ncbi:MULTISPECIES: winged helix-turn-helix transcriptional regulator [Thermomonosporaceae]|uniref:winged helix-turn-helix transcriptional regulator n=1 Tax=Thermomonosporaceae TaxID=2012 RepID=UPI00255AE423|nr:MULTISPECIES: helix-turn-helix domain-containing protein [Thermomonosporaceae]MDL4773370.1 helix-turn-helix domain-containing protein [Actinomadura xylanilytica]